MSVHCCVGIDKLAAVPCERTRPRRAAAPFKRMDCCMRHGTWYVSFMRQVKRSVSQDMSKEAHALGEIFGMRTTASDERLDKHRYDSMKTELLMRYRNGKLLLAVLFRLCRPLKGKIDRLM